MGILNKIKNRINDPRLIRRDVRHTYQRLTRGFSDAETWSLDYSLGRAILPRLKRFKEVTPGTPDGLSEVEWHQILDKMIEAFEFASSETRWNASNEEYLKHQEGIDLFAKHFFGLWW